MLAKIRRYIPNSITLVSIAFGLSSILMGSQGYLQLAGYFIFGSFFMDALDGIIARKWEVQSMLGLQLDSLADIVGLGIAPLALLFHHLSYREAVGLWSIPFLIVTHWATTFRLARYNLLPPKDTIQKDSIGLSLFHTAFMITVAVLSDLSFSAFRIPFGVYIGFLLILSISMISKLNFPSIPWFFSSRQKTIVILLGLMGSLFFLPLFTSLLLFSLIHLIVSMGRAYHLKKINQTPTS
jgi:CDP-diacylglycerol--serine O-phosphatidyltransferase